MRFRGRLSRLWSGSKGIEPLGKFPGRGGTSCTITWGDGRRRTRGRRSKPKATRRAPRSRASKVPSPGRRTRPTIRPGRIPRRPPPARPLRPRTSGPDADAGGALFAAGTGPVAMVGAATGAAERERLLPGRGRHAALAAAEAREGTRRPEPVHQGRGPQPDGLVQGARHGGGGLAGCRARRDRFRRTGRQARR